VVCRLNLCKILQIPSVQIITDIVFMRCTYNRNWYMFPIEFFVATSNTAIFGSRFLDGWSPSLFEMALPDTQMTPCEYPLWSQWHSPVLRRSTNSSIYFGHFHGEIKNPRRSWNSATNNPPCNLMTQFPTLK